MNLKNFEMSVLAGALNNTEKRFSWLSNITDDYFLEHNHKIIYNFLIENKSMCEHDALLRIESLGYNGGFDMREFLNFYDVEGDFCSSPYALEEISRFKHYRDVGRVFGNINPKDPDVDDMKALIDVLTLDSTRDSKEVVSAVDALEDVCLTIMDPKRDFATSKKTGWKMFDELTGGLRNGLYFSGGKPGTGKTTHALQLLYHYACEHPNELVMFHSLEMSLEQLKVKLASLITKLTEEQFVKASKHNGMTPKDTDQFMKFFKKNTPPNLMLFPHDSLTPLQFKQENDNLIKKHNMVIGLCAIDYIQIMSCDNPRITDETARIQHISNNLRPIAKENYPVYCLAQLQKNVETGVRPSMSALKNSSQLEQDAVGIFMLWSPLLGQVNLFTAKNRFGASGVECEMSATFSQNRFDKLNNTQILDATDEDVVSFM